FSFPKSSRILKRSEFLSIKNDSLTLHAKSFVIILKKNPNTNSSRIGITVSKKVDKRAVVRNKVKRKIRELFRLNSYKFKETFDILIIARKHSVDCDFSEMKRQILGTLAYNNFLKNES
ncbi:UNVERIFIED_CONTAM: hypothetical protein GTU68_049286, partial [Idotea baltica]|nr:hypothetical protein [Idotea baltica]